MSSIKLALQKILKGVLHTEKEERQSQTRVQERIKCEREMDEHRRARKLSNRSNQQISKA
jgi:hypothetical protein